MSGVDPNESEKSASIQTKKDKDEDFIIRWGLSLKINLFSTFHFAFNMHIKVEHGDRTLPKSACDLISLPGPIDQCYRARCSGELETVVLL